MLEFVFVFVGVVVHASAKLTTAANETIAWIRFFILDGPSLLLLDLIDVSMPKPGTSQTRCRRGAAFVARIKRCQPTRDANNSSSAGGSHLPHKCLRKGRCETLISTPSKQDKSERASDLL